MNHTTTEVHNLSGLLTCEHCPKGNILRIALGLEAFTVMKTVITSFHKSSIMFGSVVTLS